MLEISTTSSVKKIADIFGAVKIETIDSEPLAENRIIKFCRVIKITNKLNEELVFSINLHESEEQSSVLFFVDVIKNDFLDKTEIQEIKKALSLEVKESLENKVYFIIKRAKFLDLTVQEGNYIDFQPPVYSNCEFENDAFNPYRMIIKKEYSSNALIEFFMKLPFFSHKKTIFNAEKYQAFYFKQPRDLSFNENLKAMMELQSFLRRRNFNVEFEFCTTP